MSQMVILIPGLGIAILQGNEVEGVLESYPNASTSGSSHGRDEDNFSPVFE